MLFQPYYYHSSSYKTYEIVAVVLPVFLTWKLRLINLNFLPKVMQSMADLDVKASILTLNLPSPSSLKRLSLLQISLSNWAH